MKLSNINTDAFNCGSPNGGMFGLGTILNGIIDAVNANTDKSAELEAKIEELSSADTPEVQSVVTPAVVKASKKAK